MTSIGSETQTLSLSLEWESNTDDRYSVIQWFDMEKTKKKNVVFAVLTRILLEKSSAWIEVRRPNPWMGREITTGRSSSIG